jgi:C4-type Zn-finger protein
MCLAIEEMKKEASEATEATTTVSNIKSIMEKLQYNAEQAMDLLGIPEEKRKKYVELLNG